MSSITIFDNNINPFLLGTQSVLCASLQNRTFPELKVPLPVVASSTRFLVLFLFPKTLFVPHLSQFQNSLYMSRLHWCAGWLYVGVFVFETLHKLAQLVTLTVLLLQPLSHGSCMPISTCPSTTDTTSLCLSSASQKPGTNSAVACNDPSDLNCACTGCRFECNNRKTTTEVIPYGVYTSFRTVRTYKFSIFLSMPISLFVSTTSKLQYSPLQILTVSVHLLAAQYA